MDIKDYLHYYIGCKVLHLGKENVLIATHYDSNLVRMELPDSGQHLDVAEEVKPVLRRISSMTEDDIYALLNVMFPDDITERPDIDDYQFEMFYNDDATMVDGDVAVGANYTCSCYIGQIAITHDGTIQTFGEDGEREKQYNIPKAYAYLHSIGIWLYGNQAFDEGLIIDMATIEQKNSPH